MTAETSAQITDLTVDDHACLTFGEPEELFDLTAAFVRDGLAAGLKVVWLSDAGPAQAAGELARRGIAVQPAISAGQMIAAGYSGRLLSGQAFLADRAVDWLTGQLASARSEGFPGLRVAVDMSWALRPVTGIEQLPQFEEGIAAVLSGTTAAVLCQYDRDRFDPVTLASVAGFHTRSVAAATYYADPVLRICRQYAPAGLRIAGEIDYQAADALALALAETVRIDGDITINMASLAFIDAQCTLLIAEAARAAVAGKGTGSGGAGAAPARTVALRCPAEIAKSFARLGIAGVPGVRLETADG